MGLRHGLFAGFSLVAIAASASAQTPPQSLPLASPPKPLTLRPEAPAISPTKVAQAQTLAPHTKAASASATPAAHSVPHTLIEALAATYSYQPALQAERAKLRATDENVPTALAGWRPTVVLAGNAGYGSGLTRELLTTVTPAENFKILNPRQIAAAQATLTQNLYTGGKVSANVNLSKNQVMAERATLIATEQTSFNNAVSAYVGVIQSKQLLDLQINNEQVLAKQLEATNDRFRVGEITRTDVAQAEAALEGARATRETAVGNLQIARATFQQIIGVFPPDDLVEPQPLNLPVKSEQQAATMASFNNPSVITALFNDAAAKDAIDVAFSALLPQLSLQGQTFQQNNSAARNSSNNGYQVVAQLSVPLYQGGSEYAAVRQARQGEQQTQRLIDDAKRTAVQNAVQAWDTLVAAKASADSTRAQIRANEIALEGTEREAIVGSRTTLDVLNATQLLLQSRTTLVQNLAQVITASYGVAVAIGRLTARDMHLPVPLYDETAYYQAVKDRWAGLGDYATNQPGR
jgi:outer membrane protein